MKELTREQAIDALREALLDVAGEEDHSICRVAQERNLFCRGFAQWKLHELRDQYPQVVRSRHHLTREQMEELADRWQVARQFATGEATACDVQLHEGDHRTCKGWDEFDDERLQEFYRELCGEEILIRSAEGTPDGDA